MNKVCLNNSKYAYFYDRMNISAIVYLDQKPHAFLPHDPNQEEIIKELNLEEVKICDCFHVLEKKDVHESMGLGISCRIRGNLQIYLTCLHFLSPSIQRNLVDIIYHMVYWTSSVTSEAVPRN